MSHQIKIIYQVFFYLCSNNHTVIIIQKPRPHTIKYLYIQLMQITQNQERTRQIINTKILDKLNSNKQIGAHKPKVKSNMFISPKMFDNIKKTEQATNSQFKIKPEISRHETIKNQSVNTIFQKAKSYLFETKDKVNTSQVQESKKRNISAVWRSRRRSAEKSGLLYREPALAKFITKNGQQPHQYELKMQIKTIYPNKNDDQQPKSKRVKTKLGQFKNTRKICVSQTDTRQSFLPNKQIYFEKKYSSIIEYNKEERSDEQIDKIQFDETKKLSVTSAHTQPKHHQRYHEYKQKKFSVVSNIKHKIKQQKQKEIEAEKQKIYHIEKILEKPEMCDQERINLVPESLFQKLLTRNDVLPERLNKQLTANCFNLSFLNLTTNEITPIFVKDEAKRVEIASITKIMTCYLILSISELFNLDIYKEKLIVGANAAKMPGTSANFEYSDNPTIYQALHGLMLPSGNDAAVALAHWGGKNIKKYCNIAKTYMKLKHNETKQMCLVELFQEPKNFQRLFIFHMNKAAKFLNLTDTNFMNPHGLMNFKSYSTASDVALMTSIAYQNEVFRRIVGTRKYECKLFNRTFSIYRKVQWTNTNKLLNIEGFAGIKTGVTSSAGPCLASLYQINPKQCIVIVVLKTNSMQLRFQESLSLLVEYFSESKIGFENLKRALKENWGATYAITNQQEANNIMSQREFGQDQEDASDEDSED